MISFFAKELREENGLPMSKFLMSGFKYHAQIVLLVYLPGQDGYKGIFVFRIK
jgi:hypothetical protein